MVLLSDLYDISSKGNLRGKAAGGFGRPTLSQFLTAHPPYEEIKNFITISSANDPDLVLTDGNVKLNDFGEYTLTTNAELQVSCKLWGAAGGSVGGGVGGYTYGELTLLPNTTYKIVVGEGGNLAAHSNVGAYGGYLGGGNCGEWNRSGRGGLGTGGGLTGLFKNSITHNDSLLIAGAGGGSREGTSPTGGNGGGLTGGTGASSGNGGGGGGGSQTSGGYVGNPGSNNAGEQPGSALQGGHAAVPITKNYSGGGGGSGYYGGGAGGANNIVGGRGGGGSGFIHPTLVTNGQTIRLNNRGGPVPNNSDPDYINNAGVPIDQTDGNNGLFVLTIL